MKVETDIVKQKVKLSLTVKKQLEEVFKKGLKPDTHTLKSCFRGSQYYFFSKVLFIPGDNRACLSASHPHAYSLYLLIIF